MTLMMAVAAPEPHHQSPLFHMSHKWQHSGHQGPRISLCVGCGSEIYDQYILRVSPDLEWHAACLKCHDCHEFLDESCTCFVRDGKTYCKRDYLRLFGAKCSKCSMGFSKNDMVMRARNKIYHVECFRCVVCTRQLTRGDEFALREGDLFCKADHDIVDKNSLGSSAASSSSSSSLTPLTPITPDCLKDAMMGVSPSLTLLGSAPHPHHPMPSGGDLNGHMNSANISPSGATGAPAHLTPLSGLGMDHAHTGLEGLSPQHSLTALQPMGGSVHHSQGPQPPSSQQNASHHHQSHHSSSRHSSRSSRSGKNSDHKPTRVRTVLNEKQLQTLRNCYNANPRPDALMKEQLVEITGLSPRVIRVWFQNKRCKDKKRSILMKQIQQQEKDGRQMSIGQMRGVPMVAGSPVRHDSPGPMGAGLDVHSYQPPWKALADYASLQPDIDPNAPQFQHLVSQMHGYNDGLSINDASLSSMGHAGPPTGPCTPLSYLDPSDMHPGHSNLSSDLSSPCNSE